MPQLNPAPWFSTTTFSWFIFMTLIPPKVIEYIFPKKPAPKTTQKPKTEPWGWPWH
uniref:ATP synthase complex subunit 8 n=1 Tax=Nandus nandus TaxID=248996 RepID=A0A1V1FW52_9TELE|nr:ATPase subunit 8 [Nandus nandus]BBU25999.1 ATPase subunit 8 [Nandus nandus]